MAHSLLDQTTTSQWKVFFKAVFHSTSNRTSLFSQGTSGYKPGYPSREMDRQSRKVTQSIPHLILSGDISVTIYDTETKRHWGFLTDIANYLESGRISLTAVVHCRCMVKKADTTNKLTPTETSLMYMVNTVWSTGSLQDVCVSQSRK